MCGIYGTYNATQDRINEDYLDVMVRATETRGADAGGFAVLTRKNKVKVYKTIGKLSKHRQYANYLRCMSAAKILIGHCRLTTHGSEKDMRNNHPHSCNNGLLVHNGIVSNHADLKKQFGLVQESDCDTEVIGRLVDHLDCKSIGLSVAMAFEFMYGYGNAIAMLAGKKLILARNGNPIHYSMEGGILTFASESIALPEPNEEDIYKMSDCMVIVFSQNADRKIEAVEYQTIDASLSTMNYWVGDYSTTVNGGKSGKRGAVITSADLDDYDVYNQDWEAYVAAHQG